MSDLISAAILKYDFRPARKGESAEAYRQALIKYVEKRDWSEAHELRVGRPQAEWTESDVEQFQKIVFAFGPVRDEFRPGTITGFPIVDDGSVYPATDEILLDFAVKGLQFFMKRRQEEPRADIVPVINVLLTTGKLLTTIPTQNEDRIAILKYLVRTEPVFGFFTVADMYIHHIDLDVGKKKTAVKMDAFVAHVGTRERRIMKMRPYRYETKRNWKGIEEEVAVFIDPPPQDVDKAGLESTYDPYAGIFVSVPQSSGPPS